MADQASEPASSSVEQGSSFSMISFLTELLGSPLNLVLLGVCGVLLYKIFKGKKQDEPSTQREPELPPMKKRDFTLEQMREFDGRGPDGRVLLCVNGKVFDVTRGRRFYGPGGPYGVFAGRDASRGLATFSLGEDSIKDEYDDLSDLNTMQMDSIREWEMQFQEKYDYIGKLLKPGEKPTEYSDTEEEQSSHEKSKDD